MTYLHPGKPYSIMFNMVKHIIEWNIQHRKNSLIKKKKKCTAEAHFVNVEKISSTKLILVLLEKGKE